MNSDDRSEDEGIGAVRSMWDSIHRRDKDAFLGIFTDDAELRSAWSALEGVGTYRGREGLQAWWNGFLLDTVDTYEGDVEQAIALDGIVLAFVRVVGAGESSGFEVSRVVGQLFLLEGARISRLSVHLNPADAFAEAAAELAEGGLDG